MGKKGRSKYQKQVLILISSIILLALAIISSSQFKITGNLIKISNDFSQKVDITFTENTNLTFNIRDLPNFKLLNLKISGNFKGEGTAKVFLNYEGKRYLIYDTSKPKQTLTGMFIRNSNTLIEETNESISTEVINSDISEKIESYKQKTFTEECYETCSFSEILNATEYNLEIEVQDGELYISEIKYSLEEITLPDITLKLKVKDSLGNEISPKKISLEDKEKKIEKYNVQDISYNSLSTLEVAPKEKYNFEISFDENSPIKKVKLKDVIIDKDEINLILDKDITIHNSVQAFAINSSEIKFSKANLTITAKGNELYKCENWSFEEKTCNGKWQFIRRIVPNQEYEIELSSESSAYMEIILITKASHLNEKREWLSDIYNAVKELDNIWSENINENEYVQITFERAITSRNDISIYPQIIEGSPQIEIYEAYSNNLIAKIEKLQDNKYNKIYLTNLIGQQDKFDLKIINGSIKINHIIDPNVVINFTTNGSWTVPKGVRWILVEAWGGGGTGGSTKTNVNIGAGGGAGGQYARANISVIPGQVFNISVAPRRSHPGTADTNGLPGFNTSFFNATGTYVLAVGGAPGLSGTNSGIGGNGSTSGGIGNVVYAGGNGATRSLTSYSGAGGGGAGSTGPGGNASGLTAGTGTVELGGSGGAGRTTTGNGYNGSDYGGGGGGARRSAIGGSGGQGFLRITYFNDTEAPIINIISPQNITYNEKTILVNLSIIDDYLDKVWYNWNGTNYTYIEPLNITFNEGTFTLEVWANDTYGNLNYTSVTFTIKMDYAPIVNLSYPENGKIIENSRDINFTCNATDDNSLSNVTFYWNYSGLWEANETKDINGNYSNVTFERKELDNKVIIWNCKACDNASNCAYASSNYTLIINYTDQIPPSTITNLRAINQSIDWIYWNWTNPSDSDFNHVEVWLNGTFRTNTSNNYYNATGLNASTYYQIQIRTVDNFGNINLTWVSDDAQTLAVSQQQNQSIISSNGTPVNATLTIINETGDIVYIQTNNSYTFDLFQGNYTIKIEPVNSSVLKTITYYNYTVDNNFTLPSLDFPNITLDGANDIFAVNPLGNFNIGKITVNLTGTSIVKCVNYNFTNQSCEEDNWETLAYDLTPGTLYNITISPGDPGFAILNGTSLTNDTYIYSYSPNSNYGSSTTMLVGTPATAGRNYRSLIKFNLSDIPHDVRIDNAILTLYVSSVANNNNRIHNIHKINDNRLWVEMQATWNVYSNGNSWTNPGGDYNSTISSSATINTTGYYSFNLTDDVQFFVNNLSKNQGWLIKDSVEGVSNSRKTYVTSNSGTGSQRPKLEINWTDITPPKWDNLSQNNSEPTMYDYVELSVYWSDNVNLSHAILSTNETGDWINYTIYGSPLTLNGKSSWTNFTWHNETIKGGTVVSWKVYVNDTSNNWNVTDEMSFIVQPTLSVSLINDTVDFGNVLPSLSYNTTNPPPYPFTLQNDGNVKANISIKADNSIFQSVSLDNEAFQSKVGNTSEINAFDWLASQVEWTNISSIQKLIVALLDFIDSRDSANVHLAIKVPEEESAGLKNTTLTFVVEQA